MLHGAMSAEFESTSREVLVAGPDGIRTPGLGTWILPTDWIPLCRYEPAAA